MIGKLRPDISISCHLASRPRLNWVLCFGEAKAGDSSFSVGNFYQAVRYAVKLKEATNRPFVYGFLANALQISFFRVSTSTPIVSDEGSSSSLVNPALYGNLLLSQMDPIPIYSETGFSNVCALLHTLSVPPISDPEFTLEGVTLTGYIHSGKYSRVFSGVRDEKEVVVKYCSNIDCYWAEKTILQLLRKKLDSNGGSNLRTTVLVENNDDKRALVLSPKAEKSCASRNSLKANDLIYTFSASNLQSLFFAIKELHLYGIVHRDLRPANVLIAGDGGLVVADWGFSREHSMDSRDGGPESHPQNRTKDWYDFVHHFLNPMQERLEINVTRWESISQPYATRLKRIERAVDNVVKAESK